MNPGVTSFRQVAQEAVEQQQRVLQEVRAAAADVRSAAAAPVTLDQRQWGTLGTQLAALQADLQASPPPETPPAHAGPCLKASQ